MTPHQRELARQLIDSFAKAKQEARAARAKATRSMQSAELPLPALLAEAEAKERQLAGIVEQMDELTQQLW